MGTRKMSGDITMGLFATLCRMYRADKEKLIYESSDPWESKLCSDTLSAYPMAIMVWESYLYSRLLTPWSGINLQNHIINDLRDNIDKWDLETKTYIFPKWILGQTFDKSSQPFQDFKKIIQLRNSIVHFKWDKVPVKVVEDLAQRKITLYKASNEEFSWTYEVSSIDCFKWAINTIVDMIRQLNSFFPETHIDINLDFYQKVE